MISRWKNIYKIISCKKIMLYNYIGKFKQINVKILKFYKILK